MARYRIFQRGRELCLSASSLYTKDSKMEQRLIADGWELVGGIFGYDLGRSKIPTMTEVLNRDEAITKRHITGKKTKTS